MKYHFKLPKNMMGVHNWNSHYVAKIIYVNNIPFLQASQKKFS